ncbi:MAG: DUF3696 domain-containing protein [Caldilineaceae bacterium SB0662_bin_9]|uniref:DUF3696 domain-containing protein n=1 Tax=Caldilineaceae bacterium SB0662_bin_9 TaxID=2605258 RepID=A0A6B1DX62_9CHLR|nr:DUF3696 domain-containing protein [Caldilineaceae bacterium SB0662_bin_9]
MITQLELEDFKCFSLLKLPLGPLTLLSGTNSSGKSTVLQSLVLLQQTMQINEWSTHLTLNGDLVSLGTVTDVLHQEARDRFRVGLADDSTICQWVFAGSRDEMSLTVENVSVGTKTVCKPQALRHLLPPKSNQEALSLVRRIHHLNYISAERDGPKDSYPLQDPQLGSTVGRAGEYAVSVLFLEQNDRIAEDLRLPGRPPTLRAQVEARLESFFSGDIALEVQWVPNTNAVTLRIRTSSDTDFARPVHVGFGITQILPIIVAVLTAPVGSIHLIENPEVHLHPAGQALMGQFLVEAVRAGHQLIVETHSDHVLNGIRRSVKDGNLRSDQIAIHFFQSQFLEDSQVLSMALDSAGNVDVWPEGFFDQFDKDMNYFAGWSN